MVTLNVTTDGRCQAIDNRNQYCDLIVVIFFILLEYFIIFTGLSITMVGQSKKEFQKKYIQ